MFRKYLLFIIIVSLVIAFSPQASCNPKFGFTPSGNIYRIDYNQHQTKAKITLFTPTLHQIEQWEMTSASKLDDMLVDPKEEGLVSLDDSWTIRSLKLDRLKDPLYIGQAIFQPVHGKNTVHLFNYHPSGSQLFFSQIHYSSPEELERASKESTDKMRMGPDQDAERISHEKSKLEAQRSELLAQQSKLLNEKTAAILDAISRNSAEKQKEHDRLQKQEDERFNAEEALRDQAHQNLKQEKEEAYNKQKESQGFNVETYNKHWQSLLQLDKEHSALGFERRNAFNAKTNKLISDAMDLFDQQFKATTQDIERTWCERDRKLSAEMADVDQAILQQHQLPQVPSVQSEIIAIDPKTGKQQGKIVIPNQKITHGEFSADGRYLVVDDRHQHQKHINYLAKIDLSLGAVQPFKLTRSADASFSERASYKLRVVGDNAYMLTYAGAHNRYSRILRYHLPTDTFSVAFAPPRDIIKYNISRDGRFAYALLNSFDGSNEKYPCVVMTISEDGSFRANPVLTNAVFRMLGTRIVTKIKFSPKNPLMMISSLDFNNPEGVCRSDLLDLTGHTTPLYKEPSEARVPFTVNTIMSKAKDGAQSYTHFYLPSLTSRQAALEDVLIASGIGAIANNRQLIAAYTLNTPVLVDLHGGPHSHSRVEYDLLLASFLNLGYAVASINYRGSTGYGKRFTNLINGDQGGHEVDDVVTAIEHLTQIHPHLDRTNIFVHGESYGAYLTVILGLRFPHLAKGLIARAGIYDWTQSGYNLNRCVDKQGRGISQEETDMRLSPCKYLDRLNAPLLLLHGWNDDICNIKESERVYRAALDLGKKVEFLPLETDHFYKQPESRKRALLRVQQFTEGLRNQTHEDSLHQAERAPIMKVTSHSATFLPDDL